MIKPVLRTLPSLSGNVKLVCYLSDVAPLHGTDTDYSTSRTWTANVRGAVITPAVPEICKTRIQAGLITSSWAYDLPEFYARNSDVFYKTGFKFNKSDMLKLDKYHYQKLRGEDFEWGLSRVSMQSDNDQFQFFAPLYIDDIDDIPEYFEMTFRIDTGKYHVTRTLRINIAHEGLSRENYLYRYLKASVGGVGSRVIYCTPLTNQATYYGIDLIHGGYVHAVDNMAERLYRRQNTILNFDANIAQGFERNHIVMAQIIPLAFSVSLKDIFDEAEYIRWRGCRFDVEGHYVSCHDLKPVGLYDFSIDYMQYSQDILHMDDLTGVMTWGKGEVKNIMDVGFPSLNDCRYVKYEYSNKLAPWFCRWKMSLTDDDHPYVTNNSWAFSKNQRSNYRYGSFPSNFNAIRSIADPIYSSQTFNYNLRVPLGRDEYKTGRWLYKNAAITDTGIAPYEHLIGDYKKILENYCTNWFNVIPEYDTSIYDDSALWRDTDNDCVYYNGILYDLRAIYDRVNDEHRVDKFAVLVRPRPHIYDDSTIGELTFSDFTLYRRGTSSVAEPNVYANSDMVDSIIGQASKVTFYEDERLGRRVNWDELRIGEIFIEAEEPDEGTFIDLNNAAILDTDGTWKDLPYDYYSMNTHYEEKDLRSVVDIVNESVSYVVTRAKEEQTDEDTAVAIHVLENDLTMSYYDALHNCFTSYIQWPVYRASRITYDDAYEVIPETGIVEGTPGEGESYLSYSCHHNSSIIDFDGLPYEQLEQLFNNTYVHHNNDAGEVMTLSKSTYIYDEDWNDYTNDVIYYSYLSVHQPVLNDILYGTTIYSKVNMLNASSYVGVLNKGLSYEVVSKIDKIAYDRQWDDEKLAYMTGLLLSLQEATTTYAHSRLSYVKEYEYVPIQQYQGVDYANDVFVERSKTTGHFYGDEIPEDKLDEDRDVLWADPYNLQAVMDAAGQTFDESCLRTFYVKLLNKENLFYYYVELYKDKDRSVVDEWSTKKWYKDLYLAEKKMYYEDGMTRPEIVMVYTPLEKFMQFPELYADGKMNAEDETRRFIMFYNHLRYDAVTDLFSWPGQWEWSTYDNETDSFGVYSPRIEDLKKGMHKEYYENGDEYDIRKFELVYRKQMYRVDKGLWEATNMDMSLDDYRDIYFYRIMHASEHDQKYGSSKKIELITDMDELRNSLSYISSYTCLMPHVMEEDPVWLMTADGRPARNVETEDGEALIRLDSSVIQNVAYYYAEQPFSYKPYYAVMADLIDDPDQLCSILHTEDLSGVIEYDHPDDEERWPSISYYSRVIGTGNPDDCIQPLDTMLVPVFDSVFLQPWEEALIYAHYTLHDITKADIVGQRDPLTGERPVTGENYRYDRNGKVIMVELDDADREQYVFHKTYKQYSECYPEMAVVTDDCHWGTENFNSYVAPDGTTYGFYLIDSYMSNTSDSFKTSGITPEDTIIDTLKYFKYINGVDITQNPMYIASVYKQLLPLIHQQVLSAMADATAMQVPDSYALKLVYSQVMANTADPSCGETDIIMNNRVLKRIELLRYFHAITPLLTPANEEMTTWSLKLKDVDCTMLDTGKYISTGDTPIRSDVVTPYKPVDPSVYTASPDKKLIRDYNNKAYEWQWPEYKHFNASHGLVLEDTIEHQFPKKMTYDEVLSVENTETVLDVLKKRLNFSRRAIYTDDDIQYVMNLYDVHWHSTPIGLTPDKKTKTYKLTLKLVLR